MIYVGVVIGVVVALLMAIFRELILVRLAIGDSLLQARIAQERIGREAGEAASAHLHALVLCEGRLKDLVTATRVLDDLVLSTRALADAVCQARVADERIGVEIGEAARAHLHALVQCDGRLQELVASNRALEAHEAASADRRARNESLGRNMLRTILAKRTS